MSAYDAWLVWLGALLCAAGAHQSFMAWLDEPGGSRALAVRLLRAYVDSVDYELRLLHRRRNGRWGTRLVGAQAVSAALCVASAWISQRYALLACLPLLLGAPWLWLRRMRLLRVEQLESQLDMWLLVLANALRAIPSLGEAMRSCVPLLGDPLAQELRLALHEHALGLTLDDALHNMSRRVSSPVLATAVTTLQVARRTGGDLSSTLEQAAASLRELARLQGVVRTRTAESRSQAWVIAFIPPVLLGVFHLACPDVLGALVTSARGHVVLMVAALLWAGAIASAIKILNVDI